MEEPQVFIRRQHGLDAGLMAQPQQLRMEAVARALNRFALPFHLTRFRRRKAAENT